MRPANLVAWSLAGTALVTLAAAACNESPKTQGAPPPASGRGSWPTPRPTTTTARPTGRTSGPRWSASCAKCASHRFVPDRCTL